MVSPVFIYPRRGPYCRDNMSHHSVTTMRISLKHEAKLLKGAQLRS
jgi:hypothetical protein